MGVLLPPTRAWELGLGAVAALAAPLLRRLPAAPSVALGWCGLALVGASVVGLRADTPFPGTAALLPALGALALVVAGGVPTATGPAVLLGRPPFQVIGRTSYSWYLWHWPVLVLAPAVVGHPLGLPARLAVTGLGFGLALLTVRLVEDPVRFSGRLRARPRVSLALAAGVTAGVTAVAALGTAALPDPTGGAAASPPPSLLRHGGPPSPRSRVAARTVPALALASEAVARAVALGARTREVPGNLDPPLARAHADKAAPFLDGCDLSFTAVRQPPCVFGDRSSATNVVLFGDSHAAQWEPGLAAAAHARRWRLESWTKATCPPVQLTLFSPVLGRTFRECASWRTGMLAAITRQRPAVVVLGAARHYSDLYHFQVYGPQWVAGLALVVRRIRAAGAQVVVLGPTPKPPVDVPDCLAAHLHDALVCTTPRAAAVNAAGMARERAAVLRAGGSYVDVSRWICTPLTCAVVVGNLLTYRDDNHLSTAYTRWLAPVLGMVVAGALRRPDRRRPAQPAPSGIAAGSAGTVSSGSVAARTSSTDTPGASSRNSRPSGPTSMTARSVMMRWTTRRPV